MRTLPFLTAAALTAMLVTPAAAQRANKAEAASLTPVPGAKPTNCVPLRSIRETRVRDDSTIDFYMAGGKIYRNRLPFSCPQLGFEEAFSYRTSQSQLCAIDTITVVRRGGGGPPGVTCGLGPFTPVAKASR